MLLEPASMIVNGMGDYDPQFNLFLLFAGKAKLWQDV